MGYLKNRNKNIIEMYRGGNTLEDIAKKFKVSRERIRQIVTFELRKNIKKRFSGIIPEGPEGKELLNKAVKREIKILHSIFRQKKVNEKLKIVKKKIKELPHYSVFLSFPEYVRAIGANYDFISQNFPEIYKYLKSKRKNRWSRYYDRCRNCGTTSIKYHAHGLCKRCYVKSEFFKEMQSDSYHRNKDKRIKHQNEYLKEYNKRPEIIKRKKKLWDLKHFGGNRERAIERAGNKCELCGISREEAQNNLGKDLFVTHINGKSNSLDNLVSLCERCFSMRKSVIRRDGKKIIFIVKKSKVGQVDKQRIKRFNESFKKLNFNKSFNKKSFENIIYVVSCYFKVNKRDLFGVSRKKELVIPRQICMYLMREKLDYSYPKIGSYIGGRDHTTAIYAFDKVSQLLKEDNVYKKYLEDINNSLEILLKSK